MIELAHAFFDEYRQFVRATDIVRGLQRAAKVARIDRVNFLGAQQRSDLLALDERPLRSDADQLEP